MPARTDHHELLGQLTEGIGRLTSSATWERHLEIQSRFHHYSASNVLLIAAQRPDATRVAGFTAWRRLDRFVRRGERAIWILAPMVVRSAPGEADDEERRVRGFKFVPVFDLSQTDGEALSSVCDRLGGEDPGGCYAALCRVAASVGFSVEDHDFRGASNGDCTHATRRIRVEVANAPAQRVKTLAHELGHALLHERVESRALAELEAESTAFVVCRALGIDSGCYSFGYVATWAGGGEAAIAGIKSSCEQIQRAAATILQSCGARVEADAA